LGLLGCCGEGCNNFKAFEVHPCAGAVSPANASAVAADLDYFATASVGVVAGDSFNLGSDFDFHFVFLFSVSVSGFARGLPLACCHSLPESRDVNKKMQKIFSSRHTIFLYTGGKSAEPHEC